MDNPNCDACRQFPPALYIGEVKLCRTCNAQIGRGARHLVAERGGTLLIPFRISVTGRNYRVPPALVLLAELRAKEIRHRTGQNVNWTDVARGILEAELSPETPATAVVGDTVSTPQG